MTHNTEYSWQCYRVQVQGAEGHRHGAWETRITPAEIQHQRRQGYTVPARGYLENRVEMERVCSFAWGCYGYFGGGGEGGWRILRLHRLRLHAHGHDSQHSGLINSHDGRAGLVHAVQVERHGANLQGKRTIHKQDAARSKRSHEAGPAGGRMFIMWHLRLAGMSGHGQADRGRPADSACTWRNQHAARRARKVERVFRPYGPSFRG